MLQKEANAQKYKTSSAYPSFLNEGTKMTPTCVGE